MKPTQTLHDFGQSIWLGNITRDLLKTGGLRRCIAELSLTGLTSNPTIFDHAIKNGDADAELARFAAEKVDVDALAQQLQDEGAKSFVKSWNDLLGVINSKSAIRKRAS